MKKNWKIVVIVSCLVLLFSSALNGCGRDTEVIDTPSQPPNNTIVEKPATGDLPLGLYPKTQRQFAPDFNLPKLDESGNLSLSSLKGKVVLIDFTTTWCIWCERQEPQVVDLYKKYESKGFTVIAIDCREPRETVLGKYPGGKSLYPVVLDEDGNVSSNQFGIQGYPHYKLIDQNGQVAYDQSGYKEDMFSSISKMIDYLMVNEP